MRKTGFYLSVLFLLASCQPNVKHRPGLVKQDTIMAEYIITAYGNLTGGPAVRTIAWKEKITTQDSATFVKSVELDTTVMVFVQQPDWDTLAKKQKLDSMGHPMFKIVTYTIPGKYVKDTQIPTH